MDVYGLTLAKFGIPLKKVGREWHGACPFCRGGTDRFVVFEPKGNYWCRHCNEKGWLVDQKRTYLPNDEFLRQIAEKAEQDRKERAEELLRWQEKMKPQVILGWHNALSEKHRQIFNAQGIRDVLLDSFSVGYVPDKVIKYEGHFQKLPAYTIPIVSPVTKKIVNIQFRLIDPPYGVGRYRQVLDIPQANFYVSEKTSGDVVYVVEGAKKAMVFADFMGMRDQVVGIPGINPHFDNIEEFKQFDRVVLLPDPMQDYAKMQHLIKRFMTTLQNFYVVRLMDKPDDMIIRGEITVKQFNRMIDASRKLS